MDRIIQLISNFFSSIFTFFTNTSQSIQNSLATMKQCPYCLHKFTNATQVPVQGRPGVFKSRCPNNSCNRDLSPQILNSDTIGTISLIGARISGKTTYLLCLLNQILDNTKLYKQSGLAGDFLNEEGKRLYQDWLNHFMRYNDVPKTLGEEEPIIFKLLKSKKSCFLSFFDMQGELYIEDDLVQDHSFIDKAGGLIVMIDPLAINSISRALKVKPEDTILFQENPIPASQVIDKVADAFMTTMPTKWHYREKLKRFVSPPKIDIPVAFCVSKYDELYPDLRGVSIPDDAGSELNHIFTNGLLNHRKIDDDSEGLKDFLRHHDPFLVETIENQFSNYRFFAVSSYVRKRNGATVNGEIISQGVIRPLIWLLAKMGFGF